jgi:hypothetical protein
MGVLFVGNLRHFYIRCDFLTEKIVTIEVSGPMGAMTKYAQEICHNSQGMKAIVASLVDTDQMEHYRKQLYRLCEIRQSI